VSPGEPSLIYRDDPLYVAVVQASAAVTALALPVWVFLVVRPRFLPLGPRGPNRVGEDGRAGVAGVSGSTKELSA
jgi:hypothetical protein